MLVKKTTKNWITLPNAILDKIPDTECFEISLHGDQIVLKPVRIEGCSVRLGRVRHKMKALGLTKKDIGKAVRWARGRSWGSTRRRRGW